MIYKEHLIELWVNGNKVELESQKSLNMRFNNVLFDPTKVSSTQAEYSFEFEIPATKKNNVIFDYANNLSKLNKFHNRYNAEVYADGTVIFSGTITINEFKKGVYKVNLVSVKVYSLEDIFGDMTMNKIKNWKIDFDGVPTINEYNGKLNPEVTFPLVSYGVFQKYPKFRDEVMNEYTSKFDLDEWNTWYVQDFPPSHNMLETLKRAFLSPTDENGSQRITTVGGDAFLNEYLRSIYLSVNYADGQSPDYNVGNPLFGEINLNVSWQTPMSGTSNVQDLKFPYWRAGGNYSLEENTITGSNWNFPSIQVYNMLSSKEGGSYTLSNKTYMFRPDSSTIVIPADGWYKIYLDAMATLNPYQSAFTASQYCRQSLYNYEWEEEDVEIPTEFKTTMPFEIQLVRNYDDNIELIKGKNTYYTRYGRPADNTWYGMSNRVSIPTCFPHEKLGLNWITSGFMNDTTAPPTEVNDLGKVKFNLQDRIDNPEATENSLYVFDANIGYLYKDDTPMMYDRAVSPIFICGFTSMGNDNGYGCAAVMKDGTSWSYTVTDKNDVYYNQVGYDKVTSTIPIMGVDWDNLIYTSTDYHKNEYYDAPNCSFSQRESMTDFNGNVFAQQSFIGNIYCMMYLNKNDKLNLFGIQRDYTNAGVQKKYAMSCIANLKITAASPRTRQELDRKHFGYRSETEFDTQLNLANFFNNEKKTSEWVQNIADAFNLEIIQDGSSVYINTKKKLESDSIAAVDIDDRTNSNEAEAKMIDYPKSMAIRYKTDVDEWGFEQTAEKRILGDETIPDTVLDDEDEWKKYGDSGYTVIKLNDDSYVTSTSDKNLQFSYTWYDTFHWYAVDSAFTRTSDNAVDLKIPCISKYEYMIDGYDYEESAKHGGYGLAQRFWFTPRATNSYVWTRNKPNEQIWLYEPQNLYTNYQDVYLNLSYKDTEPSLLNNFFNINAYLASNYVELDVYLSPDEYNRIKSGSLVHFDSDLYYPVEISGYDPSGYNPTTLKLMKKVN